MIYSLAKMEELDKILKKIKKEIPDFSWKEFTVIDHGWSHTVIIFDHKVVCRYVKSDRDVEHIQQELSLQNYLAKNLTKKIPVCTYISEDKSFHFVEYISGNVVEEHKETCAGSKTLAKEVGTFLSELHAIPTSEISSFGIKKNDGSTEGYIAYKNQQIDRYLAEMIDDELKKHIKKYIRDVAEYDYGSYTLIHGDFGPSNIIVNDAFDDISGVIDFTDFRVADPALDFDCLRDLGDEFVHNVFKYYNHKYKSENFLKRSKFYRLRRFVSVAIHDKKAGVDDKSIVDSLETHFRNYQTPSEKGLS